MQGTDPRMAQQTNNLRDQGNMGSGGTDNLRDQGNTGSSSSSGSSSDSSSGR